MDSIVINSGGRTTKKTNPTSPLAKTKNHFSLKSNTFTAITGTKYVISLTEEPSNIFITGFNTTPIKTSKKDDGHLFKISSSLSWLSTLGKRNGPPFRNVSKTEVKFKSGKDSVTFLIPKSPKTVGLLSKSKFFSTKPKNSSISGGKLFNFPCLKAKQTTSCGESLGLWWLKKLKLKFEV